MSSSNRRFLQNLFIGVERTLSTRSQTDGKRYAKTMQSRGSEEVFIMTGEIMGPVFVGAKKKTKHTKNFLMRWFNLKPETFYLESFRAAAFRSVTRAVKISSRASFQPLIKASGVLPVNGSDFA